MSDPIDHATSTRRGDRRERGLSRRSFLTALGVGGATVGLTAGGARLAFAAPGQAPTGDVVVVVFNRGGVDGLNLVAPFQMPTYRDLRPTIRVKDPGEFADPTGKAGLPLVQGGAVGAFPLSGTFALHPGMDALHAGAWSQGRLAVVHAAGMPASESSSRSHFESQRNWEAGTGRLSVHDGFLNRHLAQLSGNGRLAGLARGNTLSAMLDGAAPAIAMNRIAEFGVTGFADNDAARAALTAMHGRAGDIVAATGSGALETIATIRSLPADPGPRNGAAYGWDDLSTNLKEIARLIRANVGLRVATVDHGGWDTHNGQGAPEISGTFRSRAASLSTALQAFHQDLGGSVGVTVVCLSEFGRTINENGSGGTDHGRGSAVLVMGAGIRGGVHGDFPDRIENGPEGDLVVLNDYRQVLAEVLTVRAGATDLSRTFPTYAPTPFLGLAVA